MFAPQNSIIYHIVKTLWEEEESGQYSQNPVIKIKEKVVKKKWSAIET